MALEGSAEKLCSPELSSLHLETSMTSVDMQRRLVEREKQSAELLRKIDKDKTSMEEYRLQIHLLTTEKKADQEKIQELSQEVKRLQTLLDEKDRELRERESKLSETIEHKEQEIQDLKKGLLDSKDSKMDIEPNKLEIKQTSSNDVIESKPTEAIFGGEAQHYGQENYLGQLKLLKESVTTVSNQKQRIELEMKALALATENKKREMELNISELEEKVSELEVQVRRLSNETVYKDENLKKYAEEQASYKQEAFQLRDKASVATAKLENLKKEMLQLTEKELKLEQDLENQRKFTTSYLDALEKDVQKSVEESTAALRSELAFYKSEYTQFKDFMYQVRNMIRSRGPLENWVNSLFPE